MVKQGPHRSHAGPRPHHDNRRIEFLLRDPKTPFGERDRDLLTWRERCDVPSCNALSNPLDNRLVLDNRNQQLDLGVSLILYARSHVHRTGNTKLSSSERRNDTANALPRNLYRLELLEYLENAPTWARRVVVQLIYILLVCEFEESVPVEGIGCIVCELRKEGTSWNGDDVEVVGEEFTERGLRRRRMVWDWQSGGWGGGWRGWSEVQGGIGDGCPLHEGDEGRDISWEVLRVYGEHIARRVGMIAFH